jgi:hypothetical protein
VLRRPLLPACRLHYPGETSRAPSGSSPERTGLPRNEGGSALALRLSRPAQSSLHAAARRVAESGSPRLLSGGLHDDPLPSHRASVATGTSRRLPGRDLPPLENCALHGALHFPGAFTCSATVKVKAPQGLRNNLASPPIANHSLERRRLAITSISTLMSPRRAPIVERAGNGVDSL